MADYAHLREVVGGYDDDDLGAQQAHEVAALIRRQKKERGKARVRDVAILEGKKQDIVKALDGARAEEAAAQEALQRAQTKIKMLKDQLVRQADLIAAKMSPTKGRGKRGSRVESNSTEFGFDVKAVNSFDDYEPDRVGSRPTWCPVPCPAIPTFRLLLPTKFNPAHRPPRRFGLLSIQLSPRRTPPPHHRH